MNYFQGCTALITGASAGIGREMARQLAPHAHALVLVARRLERLEALKADLLREHPQLNVFTYGLDLADEKLTEDFLRWLGENNLRVDLLINNAGVGDRGGFETGDWEKVKRILDVNITALTKLTHHLLPVLRSFERAAILNVSSIAGFLPVPEMAVYAATKAYVTSFSEALRAELRGSGVSVTTVCPGPVDTEFGRFAARTTPGQMEPPEFFKVPVEQVAQEALAAVAHDRARVVPGLLVAVVMGIVCMVPMFVLRFFLNRRR